MSPKSLKLPVRESKSNNSSVKIKEQAEVKNDEFASYINFYIEKELLVETGTKQEYQALLYLKIRGEVGVLKLKISYKNNPKGHLTYVFYNEELVFDYKEPEGAFHVTIVE